MIIQHNLPAINANRTLGVTNRQTAGNLEKLSSGFRINRAADDAAGLAISEKMRGQIRSLSMAEMNVQHGISMIQTAEGGTQEIHSILQRMRELSVQSSNGTYQSEDRGQLDKEFQALKEEITRIAESTHFNGIHLLNGNEDSSGGSIWNIGEPTLLPPFFAASGFSDGWEEKPLTVYGGEQVQLGYFDFIAYPPELTPLITPVVVLLQLLYGRPKAHNQLSSA